jgi:hypothetical protein
VALLEDDLPLGAVQRPPGGDPALQGAQLPRPVARRVAGAQQPEEGGRLQRRVALELGAEPRPDLREGVGPRATAVVAGLGVVAAFVWIARSPVRGLRSLSGDAPSTGAGSGREEAAAPPAAPVDPPAPREPVSEAV